MKKLLLCVLLVVFWSTAEANYVMAPMQQNICSNECTKWSPKQCWDGYLKRKVWKMVCEKSDIKCCPGYEGQKCEKECFNCDRINVFDRRFVEIYGKINSLEETCSNRTIIINGSTNTGGKLTQNCTCPAGPRGDRGAVGPVGTPGVPGRQGFQGPQGPAGEPGFPGPPGPQGLDGMPGGEGRRGMIGLPGHKGDSGSPGEPGLPGIMGRRGGKGESGLNGLQGLQGVRGEPGLPGTASAKGAHGLPGNTGFPGARGQTGQKGDPGIDGFSGRNGQKGERGDIGFPGETGSKGSPGPRGDVGITGREGRAGVNGVDGISGQKGSPGLPGLDGRPGDITRVEESRVIKELQKTIQHLFTRLETTTKEVKELRITCDRIVGCRFNCTVDSFTCGCGMCIPNKFRCDGFPQCPDGSDEIESECDYICSVAEFKCESSGLCIPLKEKCNGIVNCADGSDESSKYCRATINCNEGNVPCRDGTKCVAREERCDGKEDCADGSDEEKCDMVCRRDQFECASGEECIPKASVCNAIPDCLDESDESSSICVTELICPEGQMSCKDNKACVNERNFCDGIKHCFDGSDEDEVTCEITTPSTTSSTSTTTATPKPTMTRTTTPTTPSPTTTTVVSITSTSTSTTSSTTVTPTTTTLTTSTTTDENVECGSGDDCDDGGDVQEILDQETCKTLYQSWNDPDFPGGKPPPLSHDETIDIELCNHILHVAIKSCETGSPRVQVNTTICAYLADIFDLQSMGTRQKRHKYNKDKLTDDEEMTDMMKDEPERDFELLGDISDIEFDDTDHELVEIELKPLAVYGSSSENVSCNPSSVIITITCCIIIEYIWT